MAIEKNGVLQNMELSIIASFDEDVPQDWFSIAEVPTSKLQTEDTLLDYIKEQLDTPELLRKISLCWCFGHRNTYNAQAKKYPVIQQTVDKNGKYFFYKGERDDD